MTTPNGPEAAESVSWLRRTFVGSAALALGLLAGWAILQVPPSSVRRPPTRHPVTAGHAP